MISTILSILLLLFFPSVNSYASTTYTIQDVEQHSSENNCWVIFDNSVYDITKYVKIHDRYMDIRSWCGSDITQAFKTKDNTGRNHRQSTYALLETFKIGSLGSTVDNTTVVQPPTVQEENDSKNESTSKNIPDANRYNIIFPVFSTILLYWVPYFVIKRKKDSKLLRRFNSFWNILLISLLLIPSLGFGIFMMIRYTNANLWNINFDFLYWHVELSLVMGIIAISHFIQRLKMFLVQMK